MLDGAIHFLMRGWRKTMNRNEQFFLPYQTLAFTLVSNNDNNYLALSVHQESMDILIMLGDLTRLHSGVNCYLAVYNQQCRTLPTELTCRPISCVDILAASSNKGIEIGPLQCYSNKSILIPTNLSLFSNNQPKF